MKPLHKIFYTDSKNFDAIYKNRYEFETTVRLSLEVQPINQRNIFPLYFIPEISMLNLCNQVQENDAKLLNLFTKLPDIAKKKFIDECIVDELQNTNEIEGVKSSREEIVRSVRALENNKKNKNSRFQSMIISYDKLINGKLNPIDSPQDIRKIYDYLLENEIDKEDLPDGDIFRKDECSVLKKSGTQQVIHKGLYPESKIISAIENLIQFLNAEDDIPLLLKTLIGHYYFGYIHPFYDGNGRTSRFISSLYLKSSYSLITSISISRGCNIYLKEYLDLFEVTNKFNARGELNYFIKGFLNIIVSTQNLMFEELSEKKSLLESISELISIDNRTKDKSDLEKNILFILAQDKLFDSQPGLIAMQLAEILGVSIQTMRKTLNNLVEQKLVSFELGRPKIFFINQEFIENQ